MSSRHIFVKCSLNRATIKEQTINKYILNVWFVFEIVVHWSYVINKWLIGFLNSLWDFMVCSLFSVSMYTWSYLSQIYQILDTEGHNLSRPFKNSKGTYQTSRKYWFVYLLAKTEHVKTFNFWSIRLSMVCLSSNYRRCLWNDFTWRFDFVQNSILLFIFSIWDSKKADHFTTPITIHSDLKQKLFNPSTWANRKCSGDTTNVGKIYGLFFLVFFF